MENLKENYDLDKLAKVEKRKAHKIWRDKNPGKVKQYGITYWRRKAEKNLKEQNESL